MASTRVQSWGDEAPTHWEHLPPGNESDSFFLFCDLKMVNSEVLNLKFFFIVSSVSGAWVDSVADFGFSSKALNTPLNAVIGRGRLILVCYIRTYVIILVGIFSLTSPNQTTAGDVSPASPAGLTPVVGPTLYTELANSGAEYY